MTLTYSAIRYCATEETSEKAQKMQTDKLERALFEYPLEFAVLLRTYADDRILNIHPLLEFADQCKEQEVEHAVKNFKEYQILRLQRIRQLLSDASASLTELNYHSESATIDAVRESLHA